MDANGTRKEDQVDASQAEKLNGKRGIRFFGDIHGCYREFKGLAIDAISNGWFLHSLGDLIDKGPNSPDCMQLACDLHEAGWLDITPGNHCEKYVRYMQGKPVKLRKRGLASTVSQLAEHPDGKSIGTRYFDLIAEAPLWTKYGNFYAVHGAFHRQMAGKSGPRVMDGFGSKEARERALYGEVDGTVEQEGSDLPKRLFNWVAEIPANAVVLVGHTVMSLSTITKRRNTVGGMVIHLDTGLEKGGVLSHLDVPTEMISNTDPASFDHFPDAPAQQLLITRAAA